MQQPALRREDLVGHQAFALAQELLDRRGQHQYRRVIGMHAHGNDGVSQQRHQPQQLLVLLAGQAVGRTVIDPGVEQPEQHQRHDQHVEQAALDADGIDLDQSFLRRQPAGFPVHSGRCSMR